VSPIPSSISIFSWPLTGLIKGVTFSPSRPWYVCLVGQEQGSREHMLLTMIKKYGGGFGRALGGKRRNEW
jgi:hypothetical protein